MSEPESQSLIDILKGNVGVLTWTRFILFFPMRMFWAYFPLYIIELGGNPEAIGLVQSLASLTSLIIVPIGGYLADYYGRVRLIASAFYFRSIAFLIYALSGSWVTLAFGRFYQGLTEYNHAAQSAIMADSMRPGRRAMGFAALNTLPNMVTIIAPTVGAFMINHFGLELGSRYLLFICFISMFFVGAGRHKFLKETIRPSTASKQISINNIGHFIREAYQKSWEAIKWTPRSLSVFVITQIITSFSGAMIGSFWVIYATTIIQLTITQWSLILFIEGVITLFLSIPAGMLVDRIGNRKIIIIMLALAITPGILFIFSQTFLHTLIILVSLTIIAAFMTPACHAFLADTVPRQMRARITSAYGRGGIGVRTGVGGGGGGYVLMIPSMIGSILGGILYGINPIFPWLIQTGSLIISLLISVLFLKEPTVAEV
ncbi:MAG: MFS transporter [Candidatus Bathyarchaeota archaeon]|nr:MAG: MFS transporter [Candidatus Bathyarchaeota archaeon]